MLLMFMHLLASSARRVAEGLIQASTRLGPRTSALAVDGVENAPADLE
jgi:hypothetical protein